jgi:hypothetical protein
LCCRVASAIPEFPFPVSHCHPEVGVLCPPKDPGEPREASRSLRRITRAFGPLPYPV